MALYSITAANWNDPLFWSSINEGAGDHTLDFSSLPSNFTVIFDADGTTVTISDGTTTFTIGEPGVTGTDANLGGSTDWSFFNGLFGSQGSDTISGGTGNDDRAIFAGDGDDFIDGNATGAGNDSLYGGAGNDTIQHDMYTDIVDGGEGDDYIVNIDATASGEATTIVGGEGSDTYALDTSEGGSFGSPHVVNLETGEITFVGASRDEISGVENVDIIGSAAAVSGDGEANKITGIGDYSNQFTGGAGSDTIDGGEGNDDLYGDSVIINPLDFTSATGTTATSLTITNSADGPIELWWIDTSGVPQFYATIPSGTTVVQPTFEEHNWLLRDEEGYDLTLIEGAPNQTIDYGVDGLNDSIIGGDGDDTIRGMFGDDTIDAGSQNDVVFGGYGDDSIDGGVGADLVFGGEGNDSLSGGGTFGNDDTVYGGTGNDTIDGGSGSSDDVLFGDGGNDQISGGGGFDTIEGGAGDDTIDGGDENDLIYGDRSALYAAGNRLSNGDFSNGLTDWTANNVSGLPPSVFADGRVSFNTNDETTYGDSIQQAFDANVGQEYTISLDLSETGGGSGTHTFQIDILDEYGNIIATATETVADGATLPVSFTFTPTTSTNTVLITNTTSSNSVASDGQVDNVVIEATGPLPADGDDSLTGGAGTDTIYGGDGADTLVGGTGADSMSGDGDADTFILETGFGNDTITGGEGVSTGIDSDSIDASGVTTNMTVNFDGNEFGTIVSGADTLEFSQIENVFSGSGDDRLDASSDSVGIGLFGNEGADTIIGGAGADYIDGGDGHDSLRGEDGDDTIFGGAGNDTLSAGNDGAGGDSLSGGTGDDVLIAGFGASTLDGGTGSDLFEVGFGATTVIGGDGAGDIDTLSAAEADDAISVTFDGTGFGTFDDLTDGDAGTFSQIEAVQGSSGADSINAALDGGGLQLDGAAGDDTIIGGSGDDTITGGLGNDSLTGGDGNDTFTYTPGDGLDTITDFNVGNSGTLLDGDPTNNDFIDLSGYYDHISELYADQADDGVLNQSNTLDSRGNAVDYSDNTQFDTNGTPNDEGIAFTNASADSTSFTQENTGVVCFTAGTLMATDKGAVAVEDLLPGDLVQTMDHGLKPLRWVGRRHLSAQDLSRHPKLHPIRISPKVLGLDYCTDDLVVSPQHRVLVASKVAGRMFGSAEVLVSARQLLGLEGVEIATDITEVDYFHLLFDDHEIVFANGVPAESLYLGTEARKSLTAAGLKEIQEIFPEVAETDFDPQSCRMIVSGKLAKKLCWRHAKNRKTLLEDGRHDKRLTA